MNYSALLPELEYSFIILGNSGNGKTTYLIRLEKNQFTVNTATTVGVDYTNIKKKFQYDNHFHKTVVWDTSGQQIYKAICSNYIRNSVGALIALTLQKYEMINFEQFKTQTKQQLKSWVKFINDNTQLKNYSYHILGTKLDFIDKNKHKQVEQIIRQITKQALQQLKQQNIYIDPDNIDTSVISAKVEISSKSDIQNVILKLIKTKYNSDKKNGKQQANKKGLKIKNKGFNQKNSRLNNKSKCC